MIDSLLSELSEEKRLKVFVLHPTSKKFFSKTIKKKLNILVFLIGFFVFVMY